MRRVLYKTAVLLKRIPLTPRDWIQLCAFLLIAAMSVLAVHFIQSRDNARFAKAQKAAVDAKINANNKIAEAKFDAAIATNQKIAASNLQSCIRGRRLRATVNLDNELIRGFLKQAAAAYDKQYKQTGSKFASGRAAQYRALSKRLVAVPNPDCLTVIFIPTGAPPAPKTTQKGTKK